MAFDETRLLETVERGARGGPGFKTQVVELSSGFENRNQLWSRARGAWNIGYGIRDRTTFQTVTTFFYARRGRLRGFRFKDWADFQATGEAIGTGTGAQTEFQLQKTYSDGGQDYVREILKPVDGTVTVYVDGVEDIGAVVDTTTGVVTPTFTPTSGQAVTADFEFDVPVRFANDDIETEIQLFDAGAVPNISIIELRLQLATLNGA